MAGPYKATCLYQLPDAGWSETHYIPGASLTTAQNAAQSINTARMGIARPGVQCTGIRVVDVSTPRLGYVLSPTQGVGTYMGEAGTITADPTLGFLIRMVSADALTKSRHYVRGIPLNQITAADPFGEAPFTSAYVTAVNAYMAALQANANLGVRVAPHQYTLKSISGISFSLLLTIRRAGRPFGLRRGRRTLV